MAEKKTEFKDLTPAGQKAAQACFNHGMKEIETTSNTRESTGSGFLDKALELSAWASGNSKDYEAVSKSRNIAAGIKKSTTLNQDCIDAVHNNELKGKTPLWEEPSKKTSQAPSDKGAVATAKTESSELSDFAKGFSKFGSSLAGLFGSKDGNPESLISRDSMAGRLLANKYSPDTASNVQVQKDLPPVPKTAAKGVSAGH